MDLSINEINKRLVINNKKSILEISIQFNKSKEWAKKWIKEYYETRKRPFHLEKD